MPSGNSLDKRLKNKRPKTKAGRRRKILIATVSVVLLLLCSAGAYAWYAWNQISSGESGKTVPKDSAIDVSDLKGRISFLLIGIDEREKEKFFNTDSIILATVDTENKRVSLLSIPRDTKVKDNKGREVKINSIAGTESILALQQMVSDLTGLPISGYMLTNFQGFKKIIDTIGGITVDVEKNLYYETGDKEDGYINLKKGVQRLNGSQALQYARFRNDALADIARTGRQQKVLKAVAKELMQISTLPKIPTLVPKLRDAVETNISLNDMLKLATVAAGFTEENMVSQTLPGKFADINGISYWAVDKEKVKTTVKNMLMGITTDDIIEYDPNDIPPVQKPEGGTPPTGNEEGDKKVPDQKENPDKPTDNGGTDGSSGHGGTDGSPGNGGSDNLSGNGGADGSSGNGGVDNSSGNGGADGSSGNGGTENSPGNGGTGGSSSSGERETPSPNKT